MFYNKLPMGEVGKTTSIINNHNVPLYAHFLLENYDGNWRKFTNFGEFGNWSDRYTHVIAI